jgi:hypothetical protein
MIDHFRRSVPVGERCRLSARLTTAPDGPRTLIDKPLINRTIQLVS